MRPIHYIIYATTTAAVATVLAGCSATSHLEDSEQLYTGMKPILHEQAEPCPTLTSTQTEVEAALATAPNGALFGSSYYRTVPYALWIYNGLNHHKGTIPKWIVKTFGKQPVLMSNVNPALRSTVAAGILHNNGYFGGYVNYDIIEGKPTTTKTDTVPRPRTAKIQYHVNYGTLSRLDSISFTGFPEDSYNRIFGNSLLHSGDPFSISTLEEERTRIYNLLRNEGYYFYKSSYTTYLADTIQKPGKVQLQIHLADSLPENTMRRWIIGNTTMQIRRSFAEQVTDSVSRRFLTVRFGGKKPPLRPRVILADMQMRPGQFFSQQAYQNSLHNLASMGIFSSADITFTPRMQKDGTPLLVPDSIKPINGEMRAGAGILDMNINAILDKPYDFSIQANATAKTSDRFGPGISATLTKRNAFRGGELLSLRAGANYEFQLSSKNDFGNSYDFNVGASIETPRLLLPKFGRRPHRWYTTPSTNISLDAQIQRRAGFFTRRNLTAEFAYVFQPSPCSIHKVVPLSITYANTSNISEAYYQKLQDAGAATRNANTDEFIPAIKYGYTYTSPASYRNPIYWSSSIVEASNIINLGYLIAGHAWNDKDKSILGTNYSQFVKLETDFRKTWTLRGNNSLVFHAYAGYLRPLGNDNEGPFAERLYIGGANDLRGFAMRSLGPGNAHYDDGDDAYLFHNGDLKLILNVEYRPQLFGSLYGAVFLDAGNVWTVNKDNLTYHKQHGFDPFKKDLAIDAGIGIRYDLDFFVLRLDWGFALHTPYDNGTPGFFNIPSFKSAQCVNFAIGYPF